MTVHGRWSGTISARMTSKSSGEIAKYLLLVAALTFTACTTAQRPPTVSPAAGQAVDPSPFDAIAPLIRNAIAERKLPGAVVLVGLGERTLYHQAIGERAVVPSAEPMTPDT